MTVSLHTEEERESERGFFDYGPIISLLSFEPSHYYG